jgi:SAM-dependent methyltransferase
LVDPKSVLDVGCGTGTWLSHFIGEGISDCIGIDGPWAASADLLIDRDKFVAANLEAPPMLDRRFDLTISLEVAEHLPQARSAGFVEYLCSTAPVVAFSAAIPLQGGTNHVNEQWPDYWIEIFRRNNFACLDMIRPAFWNNANLPYYYSQNSFLFVRFDFEPLLSHLREKERSLRLFPLRAVHPAKYMEAARHEGIGLKTVLQTLPRATWQAVKRRLR